MTERLKVKLGLFAAGLTVMLAAPQVQATPVFFTSDCLPSPGGSYVDPNEPAVWQTYSSRDLTATLSKPRHYDFSMCDTPPGVGEMKTYDFTSSVSGDVALTGIPFVFHFEAPAAVKIKVTGTSESGNTRHFDTELLQMSISGGNLPGFVFVRESPTLASTGKASIEAVPGGIHDRQFLRHIHGIERDLQRLGTEQRIGPYGAGARAGHAVVAGSWGLAIHEANKVGISCVLLRQQNLPNHSLILHFRLLLTARF